MKTPDFHEVRVVNIETTSGCNLRCAYCSLREKPVRFMRPETLEVILRGFKDGGCREDLLVSLYLGGEPFLNRDFHKLVAVAAGNGVYGAGFYNMRAHTNGTVSRPGMWEEVVAAGLRSVVFSVDGSDPAEFERLRPGARFEDVWQNVVACRKAMSASSAWKFMHLGVMCLVEEPKPLELNSGLDDIRGAFDQTIVDRPHAWLGDRPVPGSSRSGEGPQNPCFFSLNQMAVDVDGNWLPCCLCLNSEVKLGSAHSMPARAAWEGPMEEIRERQRRGEDVMPCATCDRYVRPVREAI